MKITWFGTASVLIETAGGRLLFDPFVELAGGSHPNALEDFWGMTDICITHGHVDHLFFVPQLAEDGDATVHCSRAAARTLERFMEDNGNVVCTAPGDTWRLADMRIRVYKGKHIRFTPAVAMRHLFSSRFLRCWRNTLFLAWAYPRFPEKKETLVYGVEAEGRQVLVLGSMDLDLHTEYPVGADLLILPYQGPLHPEEKAVQIVERLKPKRIFLDHFDDAYPPVSEEVDTVPFRKIMKERFPDIQVVRPKAGKPVLLPERKQGFRKKFQEGN